MNKTARFLLLILLSTVTLFLIYPILHEAGHALLTWILGGRVSDFSLTPLPHIESGLPYDEPDKVAAVSLAGMIFPLLCSLPFLRWKGYKGFAVLLVLTITAISCAIELCIAIQYQMGDVIPGDDIVLFLSSTGANPIWSYLYTAFISIASLVLIIRMRPISILDELARRKK